MTKQVRITPKQPITFGGVKLNANEIASKEVVKENGATRFVINFKNGSTIKYPQQAPKNNSSIYFGTEGFEQRMTINRLYGAEYSGSDGNTNQTYDFVNANGCANCIFDISNDGQHDRVILDDSGNMKSQNNKVKMDECDTTNIAYKDWMSVEGEGTHVEGNE